MVNSRTSASSQTPHVVVTYQDDDEIADQQQHSLLLPDRATGASVGEKRQCRCWKRLVLVISILAIGIGIFEAAFHGKEAESLQAAKNKIHQLEQELSNKVKGGYNQVLATISHGTPSDHVPNGKEAGLSMDRDVQRVMGKSVIVLKTGASVLFERLPVQLLLAQSAFQPRLDDTSQSDQARPSMLVYSDSALQLGEFTVHDALANVSSFVRNNKEFSQQYTELHSLLDNDQDREWTATEFKDGWKLDKWKFLYMWQDAFRHHPDADWYIGYEADTFVFWKSLFKFLSQQDASREHIFGCGSILMRGNELFANGGCPYIMSGTLMRSTFGKDDKFASKFDSDVSTSCCGDAELSIALRKHASVPIDKLGDSGSRFQNQRPREILFDADKWCEPILNFHHLKPHEVAVWTQIEIDIRSKKRANQTILHSDVFDYIVTKPLKIALDTLAQNETSSHLLPTKQHWQAFTNADHGVRQARPVPDPDACQKQCLESNGCTTWLWSKPNNHDQHADCHMMHYAVRIGEPYNGAEQRTSGWIAKRIHEFQLQHRCNDPPAA